MRDVKRPALLAALAIAAFGVMAAAIIGLAL